MAESVASSAVKTAWDTKAKLIIVFTETGTTARLIAKYRPFVPILALTPNESIARQMRGYMNNCYAKVVSSSVETNEVLAEAFETAKTHGWCAVGDTVVCVHGSAEEKSGALNLMRLLTVV